MITAFSTEEALFELKKMMEGIIKNNYESDFWFSDILTLIDLHLFRVVF